MSSTVWLEQTDTALKSFLQSFMNLSGKVLPVTIRKPDEDFKSEKYPMITLYTYSLLPLRSEYDNLFKNVEINDEEHELLREEADIPFMFAYQVDFWAKMQSHMNQMLFLWQSQVKRDFILPALTMTGEESEIYVITKRSVVKSDIIDSTERIFHSIISLEVYTNIQEHNRSAIPMVSTVDIKGGLVQDVSN